MYTTFAKVVYTYLCAQNTTAVLRFDRKCAKMPLCEDADAVLAKLTEIGIEYDVVEHNVADTVEVSAPAAAVAMHDKLGAGVVGCAVCQWRQCPSSDRRVLQEHVSRTQEETRNDVPGCLPGRS